MTITLVLVVTFSFVAGQFLERLTSRRHLMLSGAEYLVVGALLGPLVLGVLDHQTIDLFAPVAALLIGLVGFMMGLPLRKLVQQHRLRVLAAALLLGMAQAATVTLAGLAILHWLDPSQGWAGHVVPALAFGAAGAVASVRLIESAEQTLGARGPLTELLRASAQMGGVGAVVTAGLALDFARVAVSPAIHQFHLPPWVWMLTSVGVGLLCGVLYVLFQRNEPSEERTFLATVGVVIFASGVASALSASPLLVGLTTGVVVAALSPGATKLSRTLNILLRPTLIAILILGGAMWQVPVGREWLLPLTYVLVRALSLWFWPRVVAGPIAGAHGGGRMGTAMRAQGALPVAIALSLLILHQHYSAVGSAVILGVLVFELRAGRAVRRTLANVGELCRVDPVEPPPTGALVQVRP